MLVYDVGMNNGDDTRYYLKKGCKVIAIEANPDLCAEVERSLAPDIKSGQLKVLNVAVSDEEGELEFNIDVLNHVRSSLKVIADREMRQIKVKCYKLSNLIAEYGAPDFIKLDVEHVDAQVLREMIAAKVKPPMMSAEAHSFEILLLLWQMGFKEFRLVNGRTVHLDYLKIPIKTVDGKTIDYKFQRHSAGPFGEDLPLPWEHIQHTSAAWIHRKALFGGGWFDVHAR